MIMETIIVPVAVAIAFLIDHADFPPAFIIQETDLSLLFIPAQEEIPSYILDLIVIFLVDPGNLHIPFSFHRKPVAITSASVKVVIVLTNKPSLVITFVKVDLVILLTVLLIILLTILLIISLVITLIVALIVTLIISLIKLPVVPVAGLCLGKREHSNCE
jgi:hypothetical protein